MRSQRWLEFWILRWNFIFSSFSEESSIAGVKRRISCFSAFSSVRPYSARWSRKNSMKSRWDCRTSWKCFSTKFCVGMTKTEPLRRTCAVIPLWLAKITLILAVSFLRKWKKVSFSLEKFHIHSNYFSQFYFFFELKNRFWRVLPRAFLSKNFPSTRIIFHNFIFFSNLKNRFWRVFFMFVFWLFSRVLQGATARGSKRRSVRFGWAVDEKLTALAAGIPHPSRFRSAGVRGEGRFRGRFESAERNRRVRRRKPRNIH